ncbi:MAG: TonB-dependent receptor [Vicingus serpentipes]|nr:TonB-dependent receptor [Vicingus serpentipes]
MKHIFLTFFTTIIVVVVNAGTIKGVVKSGEEAVAFANVGLVGTTYGVACDINGVFTLKGIPVGKYTVQISAVGYKNYRQNLLVKEEETISLNIVIEKTAASLEEVVVTGTLTEVSLMESAVPIEVYTPQYFKKNPTPSLFESLQIVNGVRPQINCSVCNTGDVHINGMEGPYTMITIDGMPIVGGLSSVYGLNGIPNSMIQQMEVVKGPASTLFGSEAVGGLINVITKSPEKAPLFSFDVMGTTWGEVNTDVSTRFKMGKATSIIGVNYFNYSNPIDNNGDNFTDATLQNRVSVFNKWSLKRKNDRIASVGLRYIYEDRWGGEMQWTPQFRGGDSIYGESIYTSRYELMGKYQLPMDENVFLSFSYSDHDQNSVYGTTPYIAEQNIAYTQLHWDKRLWDVHDVLLGGAFRYTYYDDNTSATFSSDSLNPFNKPDNYVLPGLFLQDEISLNEKNKLLLGVRYDYDSRHGSIFTPRANYKWTPKEGNTIRLSFGTGYRVVNLFTEDHAATTGAREVVIVGALKPEQSYNTNLHYQKFINTNFGFIHFDGSLFYTYFTNKITPDYETNMQQIIYENTGGYAISQGASFNTTFNFTAPIKIKLGGTFLDVYEMNKDETGKLVRQEQLLTEKVSGTYSIGYTFYKSNIKIDYSGNVYGPMKLPLVENDFRAPYSDWYSIQNIQVTKTFAKGWEIYGGIKNLLNFTPPKNSILRANDPFDKNVDAPDNPNGYTFDPTYVYAPNQGIRGFFGVRYTLNK